jgi:hypothetical protein
MTTVQMKIPRQTAEGASKPENRPCWYMWRDHVMFICPRGHRAALRFANGEGHDVGAAGVVTPTMRCPNGDCDFASLVVLEDWHAVLKSAFVPDKVGPRR